MNSKIFYDQQKKSLVYLAQSATPEFWDKHWEAEDFVRSIMQYNRFLSKITNKFLQIGSTVLEGGCGTGKNLYTLQQSGYEALGIDYAPQTVALINKYCPELAVVVGDVRVLPFNDDSFDGYWSLGVIEHFYVGYHDIVREMARVIRPGGYLFLTFPHMNPLRKLKARFGFYPMLLDEFQTGYDDFYQFALDVESTKKQFNLYGFTLVHSEKFDGVKGLKDELSYLKPILQRIYDSRLFLLRGCKKVMDIMLKKWCGHSVLLVLKLEGKS